MSSLAVALVTRRVGRELVGNETGGMGGGKGASNLPGFVQVFLIDQSLKSVVSQLVTTVTLETLPLRLVH
jgi:hypothetical protein